MGIIVKVFFFLFMGLTRLPVHDSVESLTRGAAGRSSRFPGLLAMTCHKIFNSVSLRDESRIEKMMTSVKKNMPSKYFLLSLAEL
jgi:hypothetical protein